MSFFVAEFVLIMQFLWKYIDNILGKGISFFNLMELMSFLAMTIIPMAIPLTILISSVMVFGNMAERYELSSMKSAGVSLLRVMRPALAIAILTAGFSWIASNYIAPKANYEFKMRFDSIKKAKPSMAIEEGIFNKDFKDFVIRVDGLDPNGVDIIGVYLADHSANDKSLINIIVAEKGKMFVTPDGKNFVMNLFDGIQYKEIKNKPTSDRSRVRKDKYPFTRMKFKELSKVFDMEQFSFNADAGSLNRKKHELISSFQMLSSMDTIDTRIKEYEAAILDPTVFTEEKVDKKKAKKLLESKLKTTSVKTSKKKTYKVVDKYSVEQKPSWKDSSFTDFRSTFESTTQFNLSQKAFNKAVAQRDNIFLNLRKIKSLKNERNMYVFKINQQYCWALICVVFLFIGAPIGSIVKKGGYGYPLLFAILFYMIFMVLVIMGNKLINTKSIDPVLGAWLPCLVLIPICAYLTKRAIDDATLFSFDFFAGIFRKKITPPQNDLDS